MNKLDMEARLKQNKNRATDSRSEYERDEARIIHSAAFRRLQSKTQVLGLGESDFYRTRLTHSMEVAQIGRGIVNELISKNTNYVDILPDSSLISSICLAHDIGHPPFGHGGEVSLNFCMRKYGGFEGNAQTLRILTKLSKYTKSNGLNPTRRMLLGILKYPASYSNLVNINQYNNFINNESSNYLFNHRNQKPPKCYYDDETDIVDFILKEFCINDTLLLKNTHTEKFNSHKKTIHKSLDCSIMDLADKISYSLHDFEDALSINMITREDWNQHLEKQTNKEITNNFNNLLNKYAKKSLEEFSKNLFGESYQRKEAIGCLVNIMITNTIIYTDNNFKDPLLKHNVKLEKDAKSICDLIFSLVKNKVINNPNVQQLEFKGQKVIIELFDILQSDPERPLLPQTLLLWEKAKGKQKKSRVICDFISGMTDEYATRIYEKLVLPRKGSIFGHF